MLPSSQIIVISSIHQKVGAVELTHTSTVMVPNSPHAARLIKEALKSAWRETDRQAQGER